MKFLFDLFPVILFFGIFKWGEGNTASAQAIVGHLSSGITAAQAPIMLATAVAIVATAAQILYLLARGKKVEPMLWVSLAIITVFGGATIYFNNETFILWKPTVLYWFLAGALLLSQVIIKKNLIRAMLEAQISLPDPVWMRLNLAWALFFVAMGLVNLYVAFNFPLATWVNFKLFGFTGLILVFAVAQSFYLSRYMKETQ